MSKHMKALILFVMFFAVFMIVFCTVRYIKLGADLDLCNRQLTESRNAWEKTAAEKEELQTILKAKQKELNKAQLDLDEALKDIDEVKADIEQLNFDIEALKSVSD